MSRNHTQYVKNSNPSANSAGMHFSCLFILKQRYLINCESNSRWWPWCHRDDSPCESCLAEEFKHEYKGCKISWKCRRFTVLLWCESFQYPNLVVVPWPENETGMSVQCLAETWKEYLGIPYTEYWFRGTGQHQDLMITVLGLVWINHWICFERGYSDCLAFILSKNRH